MITNFFEIILTLCKQNIASNTISKHENIFDVLSHI